MESSLTKLNNKQTSISLLRHATLVIEINGRKLLIDPMLSAKDAMDPVQNCGNEIRIPMVELPIDSDGMGQLLGEVDAVVITHLHRDHWDAAAQNLINSDQLIFCQPNDLGKIQGQGFKNVRSIDSDIEWKEIKIHRTNGQHGTGDIGKKMGEVSGFIFQYMNTSIYLAGDTIWCADVENVLLKFRPVVTVVNAGGAKFITGDPITMTPTDIIKVHNTLPETKIIAVHMDTVNHCFNTRVDLFNELSEKKLALRVMIPKDGEMIEV